MHSYEVPQTAAVQSTRNVNYGLLLIHSLAVFEIRQFLTPRFRNFAFPYMLLKVPIALSAVAF